MFYAEAVVRRYSSKHSREIFKNTFFYRTPTVAASVLKIPKISQENTSARVTF